VIRINFLNSFGTNSSEVLQQIDEQKSVQVAFIKNFIISILGVLGLVIYEQYNIPNLFKEKTELQAQYAELLAFNQQKEALKVEIEKYDKDQARLNRQTDFLQKIQKERIVSVVFLKKIQELLPKSVWLTGLKVQGSEVEIKGEAESEREINEFNIKLSGVSFLKEVIVISIDLKPTDSNMQVQLKTFSMKAFISDHVDPSAVAGEQK
jgi:Tfp pilus assembly protein PilN